MKRVPLSLLICLILIAGLLGARLATAADAPSAAPFLKVWEFRVRISPDAALARAREALQAAGLQREAGSPGMERGTTKYLNVVIRCDGVEGRATGHVSVAAYPTQAREGERVGEFLREFMLTGRPPNAPGQTGIPTASDPTPAAPDGPQATDPNLLLWLDASDPATVTTAADGRVTAWSSKAARVRSSLTSAGAQRPFYAPQGPDGRRAVGFDGVDDVLRDPGFRQAAKDWTIALVITPRSNPGGFRAVMGANRSAQNDYQTGFNIDLGATGTAAFDSLNVEGAKGWGAGNLRTGSSPFGKRQVVLLSAGSGKSRLWINGKEEQARPAGDEVTSMDELRLGGRFYLGQEQGFFHGDISEVLIYGSALTDAQRASLTAHLIKKHGL